MNIIRTLFAAAAALAVPAAAGAIPIAPNSQLNVSGTNIGQGGFATIDLATGLDFTDPNDAGTPTPGVAGILGAVIGSGSGSFAGISCSGDCGTMSDILDFSSFAPMNDFYTTTAGVSFDLASLDNITRIPDAPGQLATLIIGGSGTLNYAGFDPTPGIFTLTTQGGNITTFSASTVAGTVTSTPEPISMAMLGSGLLGLGMLRRRR